MRARDRDHRDLDAGPSAHRSTAPAPAPVATTVRDHPRPLRRRRGPVLGVRHEHRQPQCSDHRLRAHLPAPRAGPTTSAAGCVFATVDRGLDAEGGPTEVPLPTFPARDHVTAGGLTVLVEGVARVRAGRHRRGRGRRRRARPHAAALHRADLAGADGDPAGARRARGRGPGGPDAGPPHRPLRPRRRRRRPACPGRRLGDAAAGGAAPRPAPGRLGLTPFGSRARRCRRCAVGAAGSSCAW